ncbi:carboxypeptidase regulatory-like domain-containing protein [bacterium]|nr:carboxypeptidase regulatory-like domain-containing protein [bacterium]
MTAARLAAVTAGLVAILIMTARTPGREPADADPWPFLSTRPDEPGDRDPTAPVGNLVVRPNQTAPFYAYVRNPGDQDWTNLRLVLAADEAGADVVAEGTAARVKKGTTTPVRLTFKKAVAPPPPPAADKKDAPAPPPPPPAAALGGRLYVLLFDGAPARPGEAAVPFRNPRAPAARVVRVAHPREYLTAAAEVRGATGAAGGFALDVSVSPLVPATDTPVGAAVFRGPPCRVRLDLRADHAPGLDPDSLKAGTFEAVLEATGKRAVTRAEGLRLGPATGTPDRFFIAADGFERAFWFEADFRGVGNVLAPVTDRGFLGIGVARYAVPGKQLPVRIEVAGQEPVGEPNLVFYRTPVGDPERVTAALRAPRDVRLAARVGEAGELLVASEVRDWVAAVETTGVYGTRTFTLGVGSSAAEARVTLDATGPTGLRFRRLPPTAPRGKALAVTAEALDPESGVTKAVFYAGEPPPDGKPLPPGKAALGVRGLLPAARPGDAPPPAADELGPAAYSATLLMPDQTGPVLLGARFTNRVGLTEEVVAEVVLVDPPTTGSVKGRVVQGSTPERPQPGLDVLLKEADAKADAKPVAASKTNAAGAFLMTGIKPGNYVVSSSKPTDYSKAEQRVTVVAGDKAAEVTLSLKR